MTIALEAPPAATADTAGELEPAEDCAVCELAVDPEEQHTCAELGGCVHIDCHRRECRDRHCWIDTDAGWYAAHE